MRNVEITSALLPTNAIATLQVGSTEALFGNLLDTIFTIVPILFAIGAVISFGAFIAGGRSFRSPLMFLMVLPLLGIMRSMLGTIMGPFDVRAQQQTQREEPGVFDWIGSHWLILAVAALVVGGAAYSGLQYIESRNRRRQVKEDRCAILSTLGQVEELLQYWNQVIVPPGSSNSEHERVGDIQSALAAVRDRLMPLLEQVHAGVPMTDGQRKVLSNADQLLKERESSFAEPPPVPGGASGQPDGPLPAAPTRVLLKKRVDSFVAPESVHGNRSDRPAWSSPVPSTQTKPHPHCEKLNAPIADLLAPVAFIALLDRALEGRSEDLQHGCQDPRLDGSAVADEKENGPSCAPDGGNTDPQQACDEHTHGDTTCVGETQNDTSSFDSDDNIDC